LHAERLLRGKHAGADQSEAVRLLWIAVEKGNPNAEVALAEMYMYGQGVTRNCDQTRILLSAAARKGSAEAQKLLQQFQREGCE
jgi:enhanced entry protein LpnE